MKPDTKGPPVVELARDGTPIRLRPVREDDGPLFVELFHALSAESIYSRFLAPVARADEVHLRALTHLDPSREYAVAACLDEDGRERIVGVGRFRRVSGDAAELAIVVGDPWHRMGVGRMVLRRLTEEARGLGLRWFNSTIDPSNTRLLRFAEACGFRGSLKYEDGLLNMRTDITALFPAQPQDHPADGHPRP